MTLKKQQEIKKEITIKYEIENTNQQHYVNIDENGYLQLLDCNGKNIEPKSSERTVSTQIGNGKKRIISKKVS